jgi:hypothetical protein
MDRWGRWDRQKKQDLAHKAHVAMKKNRSPHFAAHGTQGWHQPDQCFHAMPNSHRVKISANTG